MISPPASPPSGPRSMRIQSDTFDDVQIVLDNDNRCCPHPPGASGLTRRCTSAACRPTEGSSKTYRVLPVDCRESPLKASDAALHHREGCGRLTQADIAQTHILQGFQAAGDLGEGFKRTRRLYQWSCPAHQQWSSRLN